VVVWRFLGGLLRAAISNFEAINEKDYIPGLCSAMDFVD